MDEAPNLLVTLTGPDRPGVISAFFGALGGFRVEVLDAEQVVIRGRLVLGLLVTVPRNEAALRTAVTNAAADLGMQAEVERGTGDHRPRAGGRSIVTMLGTPLHPAAVAAVTGRIADTGANIDSIVRRARYPVTALELHVSGTSTDRLRVLLAHEAARVRVDVAVQDARMHRLGTRLVVLDVDSTLVQGEVIEMLAAEAGVAPEIAAITEAAMRGELDFAESLRARVRLLQGLDAAALDTVYDRLRLAPGARTLIRTLQRLGYRFAIVSGGFAAVTDRIAADLGIEYTAANRLEVADGRLTGRVLGEVLDRAGKAAALRRFAELAGIPLEQTVAVGDGANDVDMLAAAGLGIAFNAKPVVREAADTALNVPYLDTILYLLGISREEIEAADAATGLATPAPALDV
jgi:phosphoserine phosphatase